MNRLIHPRIHIRDRSRDELLRRENHDTFMISGETDLKVNISIVWFEATLRCISQAICDYNRYRTNKRIALLLSSLREFVKLYQNRGNSSRDVQRYVGLYFSRKSRVESSVWNEESSYTARLYIFELGLPNINSVCTMLQKIWSIIRGRNKRKMKRITKEKNEISPCRS